MTILYVAGFVIVWLAIGVITFRTLRFVSLKWDYLGPMRKDDEDFFGPFFLVFGPIATAVFIAVVIVVWTYDHYPVKTVYRKIMGLD